MVNLKLLNEKVNNSGLKLYAIAEKSGIQQPTLARRLKGLGEVTASEIMGLCKALDINKQEREEIFFATKVD